MSMSEQEARDKCLGQESCNSCPRMGDDCDGKEDSHNIMFKYEESLKKFGFHDYDIDFSSVEHKDVIALCEWIKNRMEGRR